MNILKNYTNDLNYTFQFSASEHAQALVDFFFYISFFLVIVLVFVIWMLRFVFNYVVIDGIFYYDRNFTVWSLFKGFFLNLITVILLFLIIIYIQITGRLVYYSLWFRVNLYERRYIRTFYCVERSKITFRYWINSPFPPGKNRTFSFIQGAYRHFHKTIESDFPQWLAIVTTIFIMFEEILITIDWIMLFFLNILKYILWEHQFWFDMYFSNINKIALFNKIEFWVLKIFDVIDVTFDKIEAIIYIVMICFYTFYTKYLKGGLFVKLKNIDIWIKWTLEYFLTTSIHERCVSDPTYNNFMRFESKEDFSTIKNELTCVKPNLSKNLLFWRFFQRFGYNNLTPLDDFLVFCTDIHKLQRYLFKIIKKSNKNIPLGFSSFWWRNIYIFSLRGSVLGVQRNTLRFAISLKKFRYPFGLLQDEFRALFFYFKYNSLIVKKKWDLYFNNKRILNALLFDNRSNDKIWVKDKGKMSTSRNYPYGDFSFNFFRDYSVFRRVNQIEHVLRHQQFRHSVILEIVWTIIPIFMLMFIIYPSMLLLYGYDRPYITEPYVTFKAIGHQWYWSYEFSDFSFIPEEFKFINFESNSVNFKENLNGEIKNHLNKIFNFFNFYFKNYISSKIDDNFLKLSFDSYMLHEDDLSEGGVRLLEVDNRVILPTGICVRVLTSSSDVIHCWAVPSLGLRIDAVPGRLNQQYLVGNKPGIYYGQCSELCGVGHGFMPIMVELVSPLEYLFYMNSLALKNIQETL